MKTCEIVRELHEISRFLTIESCKKTVHEASKEAFAKLGVRINAQTRLFQAILSPRWRESNRPCALRVCRQLFANTSDRKQRYKLNTTRQPLRVDLSRPYDRRHRKQVLRLRYASLGMNELIEGCALSSFRQKKGARTGHEAFAAGPAPGLAPAVVQVQHSSL